jgi:protein-S-isoprenylcysteine O-methyltransferase
MPRFLRAVFLPAVFTFLPVVIFKPFVLGRVELFVAYLVGFVMIISQPAVSYLPTDSHYGSAEDKNSARYVMLAIYAAVIAALTAYLLCPRDPASHFQRILLIAGIILAVGGLGLRVWSIRVLGRMFTTSVQIVQEHELVRSGPYSWIRHPSYTGSIFALVAVPLMYGSLLITGVVFVFLLVSYGYRARVEEQTLETHFGEAYREHRRTTCAFIPFIW